MITSVGAMFWDIDELCLVRKDNCELMMPLKNIPSEKLLDNGKHRQPEEKYSVRSDTWSQFYEANGDKRQLASKGRTEMND